MILLCNWTNVVLSAAIFVLEIGMCAKEITASSVSPDGVQPEIIGRHRRVKRVFNGSEVMDGQYMYIVFLISTMQTSTDRTGKCVEKLCTGTLIHQRFVITASACVNASVELYSRKPSDIKIFLQTRPYDLLTHKTTYNVGQKVNSNSLSQNIPDKVALILMNATFPQVKYFPKIFNLNPITEKEPLECITVGFSLLGRNIKLPIVGRVKPVAFKFSAHFSVTECVAKNSRVDNSAYMCSVLTNGPLQQLLCEHGDEGSPLLCKPHAGEPNNSFVVRHITGNPEDVKAQDDGLHLYGIANVVVNAASCGPQGIGSPILFLYMLKYGAWVNEELNEFDELEGISKTTVTDQLNLTIAQAVLPEYYDTDDYDKTIKKPIRCKGHNRLSVNGYHSV